MHLSPFIMQSNFREIWTILETPDFLRNGPIQFQVILTGHLKLLFPILEKLCTSAHYVVKFQGDMDYSRNTGFFEKWTNLVLSYLYQSFRTNYFLFQKKTMHISQYVVDFLENIDYHSRNTGFSEKWTNLVLNYLYRSFRTNYFLFQKQLCTLAHYVVKFQENMDYSRNTGFFEK